jgi:hypothetical protein
MRIAQAFALGSAAAALVMSTHVAAATSLEIGTTEYASWPVAVAMLQNDVNSAGRVVHVFVRDGDGVRVPCGRYALTLDDNSAAAFALGECDRDSQTTAVRLVDRSALFAPGGEVPEPRSAELTATAMLSASARGGAQVSAGSEIRCTVAVRPYLRELEHGTRMYVTPGRFALRVLDSHVSTRANADDWTLEERVTSEQQHAGAVTLEYEVVDTQRNATVLHDRATMSCARTRIEPRAVVQTRPTEPAEPDFVAEHTPTAASDDSADDGASGTVDISRGSVVIQGAQVRVRGGSVVISRGGQLVIGNGGSLIIGGAVDEPMRRGSSR